MGKRRSPCFPGPALEMHQDEPGGDWDLPETCEDPPGKIERPGMRMRLLASSRNFKVGYLAGRVLLRRGRSRWICIGLHHQWPRVVLIDSLERWCVSVGCGLIVYWLREPFEEYTVGRVTAQWRELGRHRHAPWRVEMLCCPGDESRLLFVVDLESKAGGIYELILPKCSVSKLR